MPKSLPAPPAAAVHLCVVAPFGDFQAGDRITNFEKIATIQAGDNAASVVRVPAPADETAS